MCKWSGHRNAKCASKVWESYETPSDATFSKTQTRALDPLNIEISTAWDPDDDRPDTTAVSRHVGKLRDL